MSFGGEEEGRSAVINNDFLKLSFCTQFGVYLTSPDFCDAKLY